MSIGSDERQSTPTFYQVMKDVVEQALLQINIAMPGRVVSYDPDDNVVTVQPTIRRKYKDEQNPTTLPLISNVPVGFFRANKSHIHLPVKPGDEGQLIFSQRSMDMWRESGNIVDPEDDRKFDLSDAVFYPGLSSDPNVRKLKADPSSIEITNDKGFIEIKPSGKFRITNGSEELVDLLSQTLDTLSKTTTNTIWGPMKLNEFATFAELKSLVDKIKG